MKLSSTGATPLAGQVALITGASSGIGAGIAHKLAQLGARVVLLARREERLQALKKDIEASAGEALVTPADLRNEAQILKSFKAIDEAYGRLDILINNAGLGRKALMHGGATEAWREMLEVNVLALSICTREALARFPESGGHLVNICSMSGHRVPPSGGFYGATKYAVTALTEITRRELRARDSRSRVTQISPGFVETEFFDGYLDDPEARDQILGQFEKTLQAEDIAESVAHVLCAPKHVAIHDILLRPRDQET